MNIQLCSYNVRGLGNKNKREQIFAWVNKNNYDICLLQETHSEEGTHDAWKREWGNEAFFSGKNNNSVGIGILISSKISCTIQKYTEILCGRMQALEIIINGKELTIIVIYGPNNDDTSLFNKLEDYINENEDKNFLLGGFFFIWVLRPFQEYFTYIEPIVHRRWAKTSIRRRF